MSKQQVKINRITSTAFAISLVNPDTTHVAAFDADTIYTLSVRPEERPAVLSNLAKHFSEIVVHEGIESSLAFFNHRGAPTIYYKGVAYMVRLGRGDINHYYKSMEAAPKLAEKLIKVLSPAFDNSVPDSEMEKVHIEALKLMPEIQAHWDNYIAVCLEYGYLVKVDKEPALAEVAKAIEEVKREAQYHVFSKGSYDHYIAFGEDGAVIHSITRRNDINLTIVYEYKDGKIKRILRSDRIDEVVDAITDNVDTYYTGLAEGEEIITGETCIITRDTNGEWAVDSAGSNYKLGGDTDLKTILDIAYPSGMWV